MSRKLRDTIVITRLAPWVERLKYPPVEIFFCGDLLEQLYAGLAEVGGQALLKSALGPGGPA